MDKNSGNGRFVVITSAAANLDPAVPASSAYRVWRYDTQAPVDMELASITTAGQPSTASSGENPDASYDGRYVVFTGRTNLIANDANGTILDVYVRDMMNDQNVMASLNSSGQQANKDCFAPRISGNGRFVVFQSDADNLVANDTNGLTDIFLRDLVNQTTIRVSITPDGFQANGNCRDPHISYDGRFIVFESDANNLVLKDLNNSKDAFVYDASDESLTLLSISSTGAQVDHTGPDPANPIGLHAEISADGQCVVFATQATNMIADDKNGEASDIFRVRLLPTPSDFNGDGKDDVLLQKKTALSILSSSGSNVTIQPLTPSLAKGQKVVAANDLTGDGSPEIIVKKGKALSVLTVSTGLTTSASSFTLPSFAKGNKVVASGRIGTNGALATTKGRFVTFHFGNQTATYTNSPGFKVIGFNPNVLFLKKGKTLHSVLLTTSTNGLQFGTRMGLGSFPKGFKPAAVARIVTSGPDVIVQKKTTVQALTPPDYKTTAPIGSVEKGQKVVGPK